MILLRMSLVNEFYCKRVHKFKEIKNKLLWKNILIFSSMFNPWAPKSHDILLLEYLMITSWRKSDATDRWFSPCTPVFSTNKTDRHPRYSWNIVESGVKHHNPNPNSLIRCIWTFLKTIYLSNWQNIHYCILYERRFSKEVAHQNRKWTHNKIMILLFSVLLWEATLNQLFMSRF